MSTYHYQNYGLKIISTVKIDSFTACSGFENETDVVYIDFGTVDYEGLSYVNNLIIRENTDKGFVYGVKEIAAFLIKENKVFVHPICSDKNKWQSYLIGAVMSVVLTQKGYFNLHGSAVHYSNSAFLFLGISGVGKSSVATGLGEKGYQVITDDVCAISRINGEVCINNGTKQVRLMEDAVSALKLENTVALNQPLNRPKFGYAIGKDKLKDGLKIKKVIELVVDESIDQEIVIDKVTSFDRIKLLKNNIYKEKLLNALDGTPMSFKYMTAMLEQVNFLRITRKESNYDLNKLVRIVEEKILKID